MGEKPCNHRQTDIRNSFNNMTGMECRGDVRGLAGLSHATAEVPEDYFSSQGVPPEKCGVYTPSWAPQPTAPEPEKNPDNIQL